MSFQNLTELSLEKIPHDVKELNCESPYQHINKLLVSYNQVYEWPYEIGNLTNLTLLDGERITPTLTSLHNSVSQPVAIIAS